MENHLEHKIKEAFKKKDDSMSFSGKEKLWNSISNELVHSNGVASFWRIAAIILALVAFGSVFGAVSIFQNSAKNSQEIQTKNEILQKEIDSLLNVKPELLKETVIVEREKIVYRDAKPPKEKATFKVNTSDDFKNEIVRLKSKLEQADYAMKIVKDSLELARNELSKFKSLDQEKQDEITHLFELKSERVKDQMQPVKSDEAPKMKLQILKLQDNIKHETGSTLLKK